MKKSLFMIVHFLFAGSLFAQTSDLNSYPEDQINNGYEIREEDFTEEAIINKRNLSGKRRYHTDNDAPTAQVQGYEVMIQQENLPSGSENRNTEVSAGNSLHDGEDNFAVDNIDPPEPPELSIMFFYPLLVLSFFVSGIYQLYIKNRLL